MLSLRASNEGLLRGNRCVLAHRSGRVRTFALREQTFLLFPLPTGAETTIVGRRAETEVAITEEDGT
jgi:hypothetical protein